MQLMKKRMLIKAGIIAVVIVTAVAVPFFIGLTKLTGVDLVIQYPADSVVLDKSTVEQDLVNKFGEFTSYQRNQIKTGEIKDYLESKNFIEHAVVSVSLTGELRITIFQKYAIVRVNNRKGQQFYIDSKMNIINSQNNETAKCMTATGDIADRPVGKIDTVKNKDCTVIYRLASMIDNDSILRYWISGIRKEGKTWYLLPSQGEYTVTLGDSSDWKNEFEKLRYLFDYSFKQNGWADYTDIDLRFHNLAVCRKDS